MLKPETVLRIKETARVEDVVGEFVPLRKRGSALIGLCPFHQEKTPSFTVNVARNIYKCFGCGKGGDAIDFLREHEHLSYVEALRWLAQRYQIEVEEEAATPEQEAARDHRESLQIVNRYAAEWFARQLRESGEGRSVGLAYFKERGLLDKTIETFGLGYCPEGGEAFLAAATEAGYRPEFLVELGLVKEKEGRRWDFYRGRVIFPIHDLGGKVIGFGARTLRSGPRIPKYVNSPESVLYDKGRVLYGIHQAKRAIIREEGCFLVEGYTDVLALHQAGIENVVASSGTALTPGQVRLIKRYTPNVTILYDGDAAGLNAALRGTEIVLAEGMNVRIVRLPDGEDPDSLVQARGADGLLAFLEAEARDFVLFKTDRLLEGVGNDPMRKAAAVQDVVRTIALVGEPIARAFYVKETARLMELPEQLLLTETNKALQERQREERRRAARERGEAPPPDGPPPADRPSAEGRRDPGGVFPGSGPAQRPADDARHDPMEPRERDLIRLLLECDGHTLDGEPAVALVLGEVSDVELEHPVYRRILDDYRTALGAGELLPAAFFLQHDDPAVKEVAIGLVHSPHELSPNWEKKHDIAITDRRFNVRRDIGKVVGYLKARKIDGLLAEVTAQLRAAGSDPDLGPEERAARTERLLAMFQRLKKAKEALAESAAHTLVRRK